MKETHEELLMLEKRINKMLEFSEEYSTKDPDACMNNARKIAEGICLHTIIKNEITKKDNLPKTLEQMVQCLKPHRVMDDTTMANIKVLQTWGNMGSHFSNDPLTNRNITPGLEALRNLIDWFQKQNGLSKSTPSNKGVSDSANFDCKQENTTNINSVHERFNKLMDELYRILILYREAFKSVNQKQVNETSAALQNIISQLFYIHERYQFDEPELARSAYGIVMQYNKYVEKYQSFFRELNVGYGSKSNELAQYAEESFNDLVILVVQILSSKRDETAVI